MTSTVVVDSVVTDSLSANSGSCTGNFSSGSISTNSIGVTGGVVADSVQANSALIIGAAAAASLSTNSISVTGNIASDSLTANSASFTGNITTNSITANSGSFATSLSVGGVPVAKANFPLIRAYLSVNSITLTNMPSTLNLFSNGAEAVQLVDLTNMNEVRLMATQTSAGASTAKMRLNYSNTFQTTAASYNEVLSTAGANGGVELELTTSNAVKDSGWLPLRASAKGPKYLTVLVSGGDGSADPRFGAIVAEFR